ncbi:MAG: hypothetical protein P8090_06185 [Gammaproteobacteria bacterium]
MGTIHIIRVAMTALLRVPERVLEERLVASPVIVGEELARQVSDYVRREQLGYYPPLDFFEKVDDGIDGDLRDSVQGIAWFVTNVVRSEVQHRLRAAFSSVHISDLRLLAFTMPAVRPNHPNALHDLSRHYTPDTAKLSLEVSTIEKRPDIEGLERLAEHKLHRWLDRHFATVEITSAKVV